MADPQTINIPQLLVLFLLAGLVLRWFFSSSTPAAPGAQNAASAHGSRVSPAHVDLILQMFPQLDRRTVIWELQRNGGNVSRITEVVLAGGRLSQPPPTFQPPLPASANPSAPNRPGATSRPAPTHPDLITKYNLASKVAATSVASSTSEDSDSSTPMAAQKKIQAWSANKGERQALLQKKKEEMILRARRMMEERDKAAKT